MKEQLKKEQLKLYSTGELADYFNERQHTLRRIIAEANIEPDLIASGIKLYGMESVYRIRDACQNRKRRGFGGGRIGQYKPAPQLETAK